MDVSPIQILPGLRFGRDLVQKQYELIFIEDSHNTLVLLYFYLRGQVQMGFLKNSNSVNISNYRTLDLKPFVKY